MAPEEEEPKSLKSNENSPESGGDRPNGSDPGSLDPSLPRRFERFLLLKRIARGGMGELYLGSTAGIEGAERPVVLKIIRKEHGEDPSFRARFLDEARIQAQLQHPGVAQILDATTDTSGHPYVVLEHVEGRNLAELRSRLSHMDMRMNWPDAVAISVSLADALAHVHERTDATGKPLEIAHRDLSPQNVMLSYQGDLKLIDFGTARGENRRSKTIKGVVFAKPGYVAPEVVNQEPGGAPADLYAFGIILWELVAGRRFLSGEASTHMAEVAAGQRNPPSLAQTVRIPRALDTIISRLTAPRIEDRYASARQATSDLVELLSTAPSPAGSDRSVRGRIAQLMQRLYPGEPARTRQEFAGLLAASKCLPGPKAGEGERVSRTPHAKKHPTDLFAGTRYRLVRELGRGSMGVVHEAVHADLGRRIALKVLTHKAGRASLESLRAEARTIAGLRHKNLVKLLDFGVSEEGQPYYAMELLEGESLETKLRRARSMSVAEAAALVRQALDALSVAHHAGVVHQDIKPANLFVLETGELKLLDFGVAKIQTALEAAPVEAGSAPLCITGTPEYVSPEQARGRPADARSDLYSTAVVLYELVTGRLPHEGETTIALLDAKIRQVPKLPEQGPTEQALPKALKDVLLRALEPVPEMRYQSAEEFRDALAKATRAPRPLRAGRLAAMAAAVAAPLAMGSLMLTEAGSGAVLGALETVKTAAAALATLGIESVETGGDQAVSTPTADLADAPPTSEEMANAEPPPSQADLEPEPGAAPTPAGNAAGNTGPDDAERANEPLELAGDPADPATSPDTEATPDALDSEESPGTLEGADAVTRSIERAAELSASGRKLKAFYVLKRAGLRNYDDPRALQAWSQAAAETKTWGEAVRVARRWTQVDKRPEAMLHLAHMLRRTGHRKESIGTLYRLLRTHPDFAPAEEMLLQVYGKQPKVALADRPE